MSDLTGQTTTDPKLLTLPTYLVTIHADCHKVVAMPHSKGGRGRTWTPEEDAAIREAAAFNRRLGITGFELGDIQAGRRAMDDPYRNELRDVARAIGRTYAAVRKRAQRIGAASYPTRAREGAV